MLIPSYEKSLRWKGASLSRRVNANSQLGAHGVIHRVKLIKKGEC